MYKHLAHLYYSIYYTTRNEFLSNVNKGFFYIHNCEAIINQRLCNLQLNEKILHFNESFNYNLKI